ncbi:hypothetical protein PFISCL1PPCAC_21394 [Pristionchus fissidentatus]|uniref:G protein-coupled receptor n=2 Tax=Pristionchus fissidentatus TaxID=1538716 RepID=A0AAV5WDY9_9BILA|nr:hypothetical protein PFISCL1PPCAC_21394 [Pristionchus fissidentatus]
MDWLRRLPSLLPNFDKKMCLTLPSSSSLMDWIRRLDAFLEDMDTILVFHFTAFSIIVLTVFLPLLCPINLLGFVAFSILGPSLLFTEKLRADEQQRDLRWRVMLISVFLSVFVACTINILISLQIVDEDRLFMWVEIARSSSLLFLLPLYFTFIDTPPDQEQSVEDRLNNAYSTTRLLLDLLGLSISFAPISIVWIMNTKEPRAVLATYASHIMAVFCTTGGAAVVVCCNLFYADTIFCHLSIVSSLSLLFLLPRFFDSSLHSNLTPTALFHALIPIVTITVMVMDYNDVVELDTISSRFIDCRSILWMVLCQYYVSTRVMSKEEENEED